VSLRQGLPRSFFQEEKKTESSMGTREGASLIWHKEVWVRWKCRKKELPAKRYSHLPPINHPLKIIE
jgi:hypothetical protein